jgi:hypothetical protein
VEFGNLIEQCWLHIGLEHTGTTSIQSFLAKNRANLLAQGYFYPKSPGETNHTDLASFCLDNAKTNDIRILRGIDRPEAVLALRAELRANLKQEISGSSASTIIFSNEHLSSRLNTPAEFQRIKRLCGSVARETKVIVYLRNQVDYLASRYNIMVKSGGTNEFSFPVNPGVARLIEYSGLLAKWCDKFGRENVIVRRFEPDDFYGGDLLLDFAAQIGFDTTGFQTIPRLNESLDAASIAFLREFNKHVPRIVDGRLNPLRGPVISALQSGRSGERFLIPKATAAEIDEQFRTSNEKVSADFFGSRFDPLFGPARSVSPANTVPNDTIDSVDAIRIAAHLWTEQQRKLGKRRGEFTEAE